MKTLWIRVEANAGDNDKVWALGHFLGISEDEAFGKLVRLWGAIAQHRTNGDIAGVPDALIERWANWRGEPGLFASAFRDSFASGGVVSGWADRQGKLIERAERDRARKSSVDSPGKSAEIPRKRRGKSTPTVRNGTKDTPPKGGAARGAKASSEKPGEEADGAPVEPAVGDPAANWPNTFVCDWREHRGGELQHWEVGKPIRPLIERHGFDVVRPAWLAFLASKDAGFGPRVFARDFAKYAPAAAAASVVAASVDPSHLPYSVRPAPANPKAELGNLRADWQGIRPPGAPMSRREWSGRQYDCAEWDRRHLHAVYPALAVALGYPAPRALTPAA